MPYTTNPLVHAIVYNEVDKAKELIASGFPVNDADDSGNLPISKAAEKGSTELIKLLVQAGANVNATGTNSKRSPLILAADRGHNETVAALLAAGADVNQEGKNETALSAAVSDRTKSHLRMVEMLLLAGADANYGRFIAVLMKASRYSSPEVVKALIAAGASVNTVTRLGSALTMAIEENRPDNVGVLLEAGADIHIRFPADADEEIAGKTPLEYAKAKKAKKIIALLEGAKPSAKTQESGPSKPADVWKKIERWLEEHEPELKAGLNPGATAQELALVERTVRGAMPEDFKEAYRIHNGQNGGGDLVPALADNEEGYFLMPAADIVREWQSWKKLVDGGEFEGKESGPDQGIQSAWWHPGWVPFASNGGGDSICINLAPAAGGLVGQIITMNHETSKRELLAPSFAAWFAELAQAIEEGALQTTSPSQPVRPSQEPSRTQPGQWPSLDEQVQSLAAELGLTPAQQSEARTILEDQRSQTLSIINDAAMAREDKIQKTHVVRESAISRMREILSAAQMPKFEKRLSAQNERVRQTQQRPSSGNPPK